MLRGVELRMSCHLTCISPSHHTTLQYSTPHHTTPQHHTIPHHTTPSALHYPIMASALLLSASLQNAGQHCLPTPTIDLNINYYLNQHSTIQYNTIQYNTIQYNTMQYNTIQYNTLHYTTIQYNKIQHNSNH